MFTSRINLELNKRIMKCLVWSVALYAAQIWTAFKYPNCQKCLNILTTTIIS